MKKYKKHKKSKTPIFLMQIRQKNYFKSLQAFQVLQVFPYVVLYYNHSTNRYLW